MDLGWDPSEWGLLHLSPVQRIIHRWDPSRDPSLSEHVHSGRDSGRGFFGSSQSDDSCLWIATPLVQVH